MQIERFSMKLQTMQMEIVLLIFFLGQERFSLCALWYGWFWFIFALNFTELQAMQIALHAHVYIIYEHRKKHGNLFNPLGGDLKVEMI